MRQLLIMTAFLALISAGPTTAAGDDPTDGLLGSQRAADRYVSKNLAKCRSGEFVPAPAGLDEATKARVEAMCRGQVVRGALPRVN